MQGGVGIRGAGGRWEEAGNRVGVRTNAIIGMYAGDGVCDDVNNNAGCNWDKGDCCGPTKIYKKPYW